MFTSLLTLSYYWGPGYDGMSSCPDVSLICHAQISAMHSPQILLVFHEPIVEFSEGFLTEFLEKLADARRGDDNLIISWLHCL